MYGVDVIIGPESKYIFVLGNSFTEAMQVPPEQIATSIFQRRLNKLDKNYQALNFSKSGHDPYDLFWRASYFEKSYMPTRIFLFLNITSLKWLNRHKTALNFSSHSKSPRVLKSATMKYLSPLLNHFHFFNLAYWLLKSDSTADKEIAIPRSFDSPRDELVDSRLRECVDGYHKKYGSKFCMIVDSQVEASCPNIKPYCRQKGINYVSRTFILPLHQINGSGHLNSVGNQVLGDALYEAFATIH